MKIHESIDFEIKIKNKEVSISSDQKKDLNIPKLKQNEVISKAIIVKIRQKIPIDLLKK